MKQQETVLCPECGCTIADLNDNNEMTCYECLYTGHPWEFEED